MNTWWMRFPNKDSREPKNPDPQALPKMHVGDLVHLKAKPDKGRKVLFVEWHFYRHEYVYIIETSAPLNFRPYWFFDQLEELLI